jgi:hypothetical protein
MIHKKSGKRESRSVPDATRPIKLSRPVLQPSGTLARALQLRRTTREISGKKLPLQTVSNLLWAACGVNRWKSPFGMPGRTAASASNSQEIDLYVALEEGTFLYDPFHHRLVPVLAGDLRRLVTGPGQAEAGAAAPVRLRKHILAYRRAAYGERILDASSRKLSWTHLRHIIYLDDPLQREFYTQMCRIERSSTPRFRTRFRGCSTRERRLAENPTTWPQGAGCPA